jgi:hypothetical protein
MIDEIGRFFHNALITLAFSGQNDFYRFFANLFYNLVFTGSEQTGCVAVGRGIPFAFLQRGEQFAYKIIHLLALFL